MEQSTNDAPPMHRAGGGEGQFKTLDGNVDEENMEGYQILKVVKMKMLVIITIINMGVKQKK